jgi:pre-mRNA-processing factor 40
VTGLISYPRSPQDNRFKNLDDPREREDLFNEFVLELEKKEREDRLKLRDQAQQHLALILDSMHEVGQLTRKTLWSELKEALLERTKKPEFKVYDEVDVRRSFQDYINRLEAVYREEERKKRDELQKVVDEKQQEFKILLEELADKGDLTVTTSKWKEVMFSPYISQSTCFQELCKLLEGQPEGFVSGGPREVFDRVMIDVKGTYRLDRRVIVDVLEAVVFSVKYDTSYDQVREVIYKFAGIEGGGDAVTAHVDKSASGTAEDGEEADEDHTAMSKAKQAAAELASQLRIIIQKRSYQLRLIYEDLYDLARVEYEEEQRKLRRREERYIELMQDYFYRSDHVGLSWDDAKRYLERHSAYDALERSDRKRLFTSYMEELGRKMAAKTKAMNDMMDKDQQSVAEQSDSMDGKSHCVASVGVSDSSIQPGVDNDAVNSADDSGDSRSDSSSEGTPDERPGKKSKKEKEKHKKDKDKKKHKKVKTVDWCGHG